MQLTEAIYFSPEASSAYMSASQVKRFMECEVLALAEIRGEFVREESTALLVGGYVDAYFSGTLDAFASNNPAIYTNKGTLRADFQQAQDIIALLETDDLLHRMLCGESQKIVTGEINGVPFKSKLDSLLNTTQCEEIVQQYPKMADTLLMADGAIVDLKVMRDMEPVWVRGAGKLSFVQAWHYDLQLAIYQQLIGAKLPCYLVVATKEKVPDKALIHIPQYMLDTALETAAPQFARYQSIKRGETEPTACGRCAWCRTQKRITDPVDADELEGAGCESKHACRVG